MSEVLVHLSASIERHRASIRRTVAKYHATDPHIFGSVARGEAHPDSDVDLLVTFTDKATLLDEVGLRIELSDLLQTRVDVVALDSLGDEMQTRVLRDAVPL